MTDPAIKHSMQERLIEDIIGYPKSNSKADMSEYLATRAAIATRILAKTIVMTDMRSDKTKMNEFIELFVKNTREDVEDTWQAFQEWKREQEKLR